MNPDELYSTVWPEYALTQRKDLFWYERLWGVLLDQLEKRTHSRTLVEYGSGPGFLLAYAERRGWITSGVEPSAIARRHADSLGVFSSAEDIPGYVYAAAIATEVLEHVEKPEVLLGRIWEALEPGGHLALSVPNDNNPLQMLFWRYTRPWRHHTHLHYFNPKSLKAVVESSGFEVVWQRTSFPVELFLVLPMPRKWAWKLSRVWRAPPILWRWNIGRHCLLVARKITE